MGPTKYDAFGDLNRGCPSFCNTLNPCPNTLNLSVTCAVLLCAVRRHVLTPVSAW